MLLPLHVAIVLSTFPSAYGEDWPQWRGSLGTGVSSQAKPPVQWNEKKHVRWKTRLPGMGHSSPIVWRGNIFLTTAQPVGDKLPPRYSGAPGAHDNVPVSQRHAFVALCIDRISGKVLWEKSLHEALPHEGGHFSGSLASASPVTDGKVVVAHFGSHGTFALDFEGQVLWSKFLGLMNSKHGHGEGSSPAIAESTVVVNADHEGQSFITALDAITGEEKWRKPRDEVTSWASPLIVRHAGRHQVIVCGTTRVRAYDLQNGEVIWECGGLSANVVATPVAADGMVYVGSSYEIRSMFAIKLDGATGDITGSDHVVWKRRDRTPYVPSPLLYEGALYFLRHYQGILTRVEAKTGAEETGPFRLGALRDIYASPVAAAGRIYITDLDGVTQVISNDIVPRTVAVNRLDDSFSASAAIVGDEIFLRGKKWLYCLGE